MCEDSPSTSGHRLSGFASRSQVVSSVSCRGHHSASSRQPDGTRILVFLLKSLLKLCEPLFQETQDLVRAHVKGVVVTRVGSSLFP
eukprot:scaffold193683_cov31-Tisochrysis_lutea.AAC.1